MTKNKTRPNTRQLMVMGIVLIVFGLIAVTAPAIAGETIIFVIGGLLLLCGIGQIYQGWKATSLSDKAFPFLRGVLAVLLGGGMLGHRMLTLSIFTLVIAIIFLIEGLWKTIVSFSYRPASGWVALLLSGLISFVLGYMIWKQWPDSAIVTVGVLVGINLLVTGFSMVIVAMTSKRLAAS